LVRVKRGSVARRRRKKVLSRAKGFRGAIGRIFRPAKQAVVKALTHATRHRRAKKRDFRRLWTVRINAAVRGLGMPYSKFMGALKKSKIGLNRKQLSELAIVDPSAFAKIVDLVRK
jgi:large subunit ribosomal protein L20